MTQAVPAGYAAPWVYCEVTGGPGDNQFFFFQAPGGAMDIGLSNPALSQYAQTNCWWFNTPPGTGQVLAQEDNQTPPPVVIDIQSYLCPAGTSIDEPSRDSYAGTCVVPGAGVQITYTPAEGEPRSSPTGPDGQVLWPDLPAGSFTVQQAAIEGYDTTTVYCYVASPPEFEDVSAWEPFPVADRTISYDLLAGYELHCEFYNLPVEQNETALTVHKYLCASELFEPAASLDAYRRRLPDPALRRHCFRSPWRGRAGQQARLL